MSSTDTDPEEAQDTAEAKEKPKLSLEVKVDSPGTCERHVAVTVSREDVDRYIEEAFDELGPKAEVPGFRPGRAPRKLVEVRFKDQIADQVKGSLVMDALTQVSEEHEFSAISEPDFDYDAVSIPDEGPFTFEFDIEVRPEFDVPAWEGLSLARPNRQYTDEDVEEHLRTLLRRYGTLVEREGPAELDDITVADIEVSHEGKSVSQTDGYHLRVAPELLFRDARVSGFDQLMVGARKGETRDTTATISDYAENVGLRGQDVQVRFKITSVKYIKMPALTSSFLDSIGGFEDEDDLREAVRAELERQLAYHQQQRMREQITAALTKDANWELPPDLVRRQAKRELERVVLELQSSGFSDERIQAQANEIRQNILDNTQRALKEHFILEKIAEDRDIDAEPKDFDEEISLIADQRDESPRRVRARLEKRGQMDALRNQIIERKVVDLICSKAAITDVQMESQRDDSVAVDLALAGGHNASEIPEAKHGGEAEDLRKPADHT